MNTPRCMGASLLLLLAVLITDASGQSRVGTAVVGAGGGSSGNGDITLHVTVGQSAIGIVGISGRVLEQGFWYGLRGSVTAYVDAPTAPSTGGGALNAAVWPNPSSGTAKVLVNIPVAGRATATLHNMRGDIVRTLLDGMCQAGRLDIPLDGTELPSGSYTVVLTSGAGRTTARFHLVR